MGLGKSYTTLWLLLRLTLEPIVVYKSIYTIYYNLLTNLTNVLSVPIERVLLKSIPNLNSIRVISGTPQTFKCATKQPGARFQWYKGTTNITSSGEGSVKLVTFNKTDNGSKLKCQGRNRVTKSPFPESDVAINVLCKRYKHILVELRTSYYSHTLWLDETRSLSFSNVLYIVVLGIDNSAV